MAQWLRGTGLLLSTLLVAPVTQADIYRWVDDGGITNYSTTPPPDTGARERQVYDRWGRELDRIAAPPTEEEREREIQTREREVLEAAEREWEMEQLRLEAAALQSRMRQLDQAYSSLDDIREQRDRRLERIATTLELSERLGEVLQAEHDRIAAQIEGHGGDARTLERYRSELEDLERRLQRERAHQERQRALLAEIEASAARDLEDYQRLVMPGRHNPGAD